LPWWLSFLGFTVVEVRTHILSGLTASTANFNLQLRVGHRQTAAASLASFLPPLPCSR
jgi:hypothetical protein